MTRISELLRDPWVRNTYRCSTTELGEYPDYRNFKDMRKSHWIGFLLLHSEEYPIIQTVLQKYSITIKFLKDIGISIILEELFLKFGNMTELDVLLNRFDIDEFIEFLYRCRKEKYDNVLKVISTIIDPLPVTPDVTVAGDVDENFFGLDFENDNLVPSYFISNSGNSCYLDVVLFGLLYHPCEYIDYVLEETTDSSGGQFTPRNQNIIRQTLKDIQIKLQIESEGTGQPVFLAKTLRTIWRSDVMKTSDDTLIIPWIIDNEQHDPSEFLSWLLGQYFDQETKPTAIWKSINKEKFYGQVIRRHQEKSLPHITLNQLSRWAKSVIDNDGQIVYYREAPPTIQNWYPCSTSETDSINYICRGFDNERMRRKMIDYFENHLMVDDVENITYILRRTFDHQSFFGPEKLTNFDFLSVSIPRMYYDDHEHGMAKIRAPVVPDKIFWLCNCQGNIRKCKYNEHICLQLKSVIVHSGGSGGGHYICYFLNVEKEEWYLMDDLINYYEKIGTYEEMLYHDYASSGTKPINDATLCFYIK
jgi:hypothetical protein